LPDRTDCPFRRGKARSSALLAGLLLAITAVPGRADPTDGLQGFAWGQIGADGDGWSGAGGVFLPLSAEGGTLTYLDARLRGGPEAATYGLGLGVRGLIDETWILGGAAFLDAHDLEGAGWHARAGLLVEAMGPAWDARLTGYWGLSDVDRVLERRLGIADGHADLYREHAAYHGIEGEIGLRLATSDDQSRELRLFGGGYQAWRDGFEERSGAFARLEFRHYDLAGLPAGSRLHAELELDWRAADDAVGVAGFLRLRLPFQDTGPAPGVPLGARDRRFLDIAQRDRGPAVGERHVWVIHADGTGGSGIDIGDPADLGIPACADYAGDPTGITYDLTGREVTCVHYVAQGGGGNGATPDQAAAYDDINAGTLLPDGALIVVLDSGGTITPATTIGLAAGQALLGGGSAIDLFDGLDLFTFQAPGGRPEISFGAVAPGVDSLQPDHVALADQTILIGLDFTGGNNAVTGNGVTTVRLIDLAIREPTGDAGGAGDAGAHGDGIHITDSSDIWIDRLVFSEETGSFDTGDGIDIRRSSAVSITDSVIDDADRTGIRLVDVAGFHIDTVEIENAHLIGLLLWRTVDGDVGTNTVNALTVDRTDREDGIRIIDYADITFTDTTILAVADGNAGGWDLAAAAIRFRHVAASGVAGSTGITFDGLTVSNDDGQGTTGHMSAAIRGQGGANSAITVRDAAITGATAVIVREAGSLAFTDSGSGAGNTASGHVSTCLGGGIAGPILFNEDGPNPFSCP